MVWGVYEALLDPAACSSSCEAMRARMPPVSDIGPALAIVGGLASLYVRGKVVIPEYNPSCFSGLEDPTNEQKVEEAYRVIKVLEEQAQRVEPIDRNNEIFYHVTLEGNLPGIVENNGLNPKRDGVGGVSDLNTNLDLKRQFKQESSGKVFISSNWWFGVIKYINFIQKKQPYGKNPPVVLRITIPNEQVNSFALQNDETDTLNGKDIGSKWTNKMIPIDLLSIAVFTGKKMAQYEKGQPWEWRRLTSFNRITNGLPTYIIPDLPQKALRTNIDLNELVDVIYINAQRSN